jgi:hypothetical protein
MLGSYWRYIMPNLRYAFVLLACVAVAGCKHPKSPYCPQGMAEVASRTVLGKYVWCESSDKVQAQWIEWHAGTTKPKQSCGYRNLKSEGSFAAWHPDGKPWVHGQFSGGQKVGKWKQWDIAGSEVAEGDYDSGRLVAGAPVAGMASCEKMAK